MAKNDSACTCDGGCSKSRGGCGCGAMCAGAFGGIVGVAVAAVVAAVVMRRLGPRLMRRMMMRMMRDGECSPEMRACMEKCGCGPTDEERPGP